MPSTLSSAATKCISDVPGLAKQVSTPLASSVRTRLSAPFMGRDPFECEKTVSGMLALFAVRALLKFGNTCSAADKIVV